VCRSAIDTAKIIERSHVTKTHVVGWVYVADEGGLEEPLGERLAGATGQPMREVVANLQIGNMIDVAAYAASLQP
jgi:hypothetical protein